MTRTKITEEPLPVKRIFEIWSTGYCCTGYSGTAKKHGEQEAYSFEEALLRFAEIHEEFKKDLAKKRKGKLVWYSYWGCELFDNKEDASASFG
jgi:hypothetical protein